MVSQTTIGADGSLRGVAATAVRRPVFSLPVDDGEWHERLQCNVLHYRQNYLALAAAAHLAFAWAAGAALGGAVTLALLALAVGNNALLLEVSAAADEVGGGGAHLDLL